MRVSLFFPQAEHNLPVVPLFAVGLASLSFLSTDLPSDIASSCSAAAAVPSCLDDAMAVLFVKTPSRTGSADTTPSVVMIAMLTDREAERM
jgi:hypothetical protein